MHILQLGYFIDPCICSTCDFHTLRYTTIVTSWKYRNRYSSNTPCTRNVILVQCSHNLYVQKMSEYPSHSFTYSPIYFHLPPPPFIPLDIPQLSPLENTEIGTALIHHVHETLSWFSVVIMYMCKKCPNTPVIRSRIHPFIFTSPPPPPMIYIINELLKYDSINYHFLNIT